MPLNKKLNEVVLSNINQMELHNKIKFIRLSKNLTQIYLADELEIDVANYSRLERGETGVTVDRLKKIAKILEVDVQEIINEENNGNSEEQSLEFYLKEILREVKHINKSITKTKNYENENL